MKGLTSIGDLGPAELETIVAEASRVRDALDQGDTVEAALDGRVVAMMFFEPSTRTRLSFELATQRLGGRVMTFDPETASTAKGESLRDTVLTVSAIGADVLVVRHREEQVPERVAVWSGLPVVNAGDGSNEHPTQALADITTIRRHFGRLEGLRVGIVGDIAHSRVAGSLMNSMPALGVDLRLVGPEDWLPHSVPLKMGTDLDAVLEELDIVYLLRVQTERGGTISNDYIDRFQLGHQRAARLHEEAVVMHPGPMNRGVEITDEVADSARSLVSEQVRNGVPVRMAVLAAFGGAG